MTTHSATAKEWAVRVLAGTITPPFCVRLHYNQANDFVKKTESQIHPTSREYMNPTIGIKSSHRKNAKMRMRSSE